MKCYKCNGTLSTDGFCNKCGADVTLYKQIIQSSEAYYNQGLIMAESRDLSGAAEYLRRSVKLNKHNIKARNLLGLVYFEMGEAVAALSSWVISKNLQPDKNIADSYLDAIQRNATRLDTINQTIKKYNQALLYAQQDSADLAIIQLKKVLTMYPNLIKGHQLLALLYMKDGEYEKALKPLKKALAIDKNNPMSLRYMKEVMSFVEDKEKHTDTTPKPRQREERRVLKSNDVIIPPTSYKEPRSGGITVLNVMIGIVIGAALIWFLVLPAKEKAYIEEYNNSQIGVSEQLESKNSQVLTLESQVADLEGQLTAMQQQVDQKNENESVITYYQNLLNAVDAYMKDDKEAGADLLDQVDMSVAEMAPYQEVYDVVYANTSAIVASELYEEGNSAYRNGDYEEARRLLEAAYNRDPEAATAASLYYLGRSCLRITSGNYESDGNKYLKLILERYPGGEFAEYAEMYITD